jgi:ribosomal protein S18 acetylase RimI-like enzyme
METRRIHDADELVALARFAAPLQASADAHVAFLGVDADGIAAELAETTWAEVSAVALIDDVVAGWLVGDVDPEMGRVWWFGPFVNAGEWEDVAGRLLTACRAQLGSGISEEEMAVDAEFLRCRAWAPTYGFKEEEGSVAVVLDRPLGPASTHIRDIADSDHDAVASLHDELFPGTHTTGRDLAAGHDATHRRLVIEHDGVLDGYIAVERLADGTGYIDFVGVARRARRRGLGGELVRAGVSELHRLGVSSISLTVRAGNAGARELYESLGFSEERLLVPLRRGFTIP